MDRVAGSRADRLPGDLGSDLRIFETRPHGSPPIARAAYAALPAPNVHALWAVKLQISTMPVVTSCAAR